MVSPRRSARNVAQYRAGIADAGKKLCGPLNRCLLDVLAYDKARKDTGNDAGHFGPEVERDPPPPGCAREWLTGEAAADDINGNSIGSKPIGGEFSDIIVNRHPRPMFSQYALAEWINFAERDRLESARAFKAKVEAADAGE